MRPCAYCGRLIGTDIGIPYAAVWERQDGKLFIHFACLPCSNGPELEDITEEVTRASS
jgi:hypothetical protein